MGVGAVLLGGDMDHGAMICSHESTFLSLFARYRAKE